MILKEVEEAVKQETKEKETPERPTNHTSKQEKVYATRNRRYTHPRKHITNLSTYTPTIDEYKLLSKGLNFIPTPEREDPSILLQDFLLLDRKLRLKTTLHGKRIL